MDVRIVSGVCRSLCFNHSLFCKRHVVVNASVTPEGWTAIEKGSTPVEDLFILDSIT